VEGLPPNITDVYFRGCTSLASIVGLPDCITFADFDDCTSLTSVVGLPPNVTSAYFRNCTSLTSVAGISQNVVYVDFGNCTRLRRVKQKDARFEFDAGFDPAQDVHTLMVSGLSNKLLSSQVGIGPDAALLIARFVTSGMTQHDRLETMQQVRNRCGIGGCAP